MNKLRAFGSAVAITLIVGIGGAAAASASGGSTSGGGKTTDPAAGGATGAASGKSGGCTPFVAYTPSSVAPSVYAVGPAVTVAMTLTNCAGGGTPVYTITTTISDPSGAHPDFVQLGSYCVRGGVTYTVTYVDSQVDAGQTYVVNTVVTASNGQVVDSRTGSVTTPAAA